ncbi:MAG: adenylate cyclase, partial [Paracoccaceae bacterium]
MTSDKIDRKIAVIFVTDVVGFSKLMEKNEDQTLKSFRSCKEILETLFLEHGGRIFNTAGDSVLAEFQSAVSAVVCASEFQKLILGRNKTVTEDAEMHFRIGINMGDVIIEGTNLYGDGVNVAARLEALCLPDSVCLSRSIHDFVSKKTELIFHDLGDQRVKNTVVHAFDMDLLGKERRELQKLVETNQEANKPPSIAVLPFLNLSNDPDQDYFADGITEDIISNLSLWKTFPVISRNSSFSFKDKNIKSSEIAQQLGVRYLVEGSVRKGGDKVRITAQLIDADEDKQIWSKKWDRSLDDIFEVQDEVSQGVAAMVSPAVKGQEIIKSASNSNKKNYGAWDEYLKALSFHNSEKKEDQLRVFDQCQKAVDLDPSLSDPLVLQTRTLLGQIFSAKKDEKRKKNEELFHALAAKAVELDPGNPEALIALSRS